jgi:hypothetical protein
VLFKHHPGGTCNSLSLALLELQSAACAIHGVACVVFATSVVSADIKTPTGDEAQTQNRRFFRRSVMGSDAAAAAAVFKRGAAQPLLIYFSHYFRRKCAPPLLLLWDYRRRV